MIVSRIDHVLLAVPDLEAARSEFESLGFVVTPKSTHQRFGTANRLCILDDAYLELITIEDRHPPDRSPIDILASCIARGGGIPMLALATEDAAASHEALKAAGFDSGEPITWSRRASSPDGEQTASFTTLFPRDTLLPGFVAFFCQHHTPHVVKRRDWQSHANGASRLVSLERFMQLDIDSLEEQLIGLVGHDAVRRECRGGLGARLGPHMLLYQISAREQPVRLSISVDSLKKTRAYFDASVTTFGQQAIDVRLASARFASLRFVEGSRTSHE